MSEAIPQQFYNRYIFRDILGYVAPGGIVLWSSVILIKSVQGKQIAMFDPFRMMPSDFSAYALFLVVSYAIGHGIAGIFFHMRPLNILFSYYPLEHFKCPSRDATMRAYIKHRSDFERSVSNLNSGLALEAERFAALAHFAGHFSAASFVSALDLAFVFCRFPRSYTPAVVAAAFAILGIALFVEFRGLRKMRYLFENEVIQLTSKSPQSPLEPTVAG